MMPISNLLAYGPGLHAGLDLLLVATVLYAAWRLGRERERSWRLHRESLKALEEALLRLVRDAEARSRGLETELAKTEQRLRGLLAELSAALPASRDGDATAAVRELTRSGSTPREIARRLGLSISEVLLIQSVRAS